MRYCAALFCKNNSKTNPELKFHKFPSNPGEFFGCKLNYLDKMNFLNRNL